MKMRAILLFQIRASCSHPKINGARTTRYIYGKGTNIAVEIVRSRPNPQVRPCTEEYNRLLQGAPGRPIYDPGHRFDQESAIGSRRPDLRHPDAGTPGASTDPQDHWRL